MLEVVLAPVCGWSTEWGVELVLRKVWGLVASLE